MSNARTVAPALIADTQLVAKLFRGFADPTRLAIIVALADGEHRVVDLMARLGGSQGNISGHLACLKECGMVADRPEGRAVWYSIAEPEVIAVVRAAERLLAHNGQQIELCPSYPQTTKRGERASASTGRLTATRTRGRR